MQDGANEPPLETPNAVGLDYITDWVGNLSLKPWSQLKLHSVRIQFHLTAEG